MKRSLVMLFSVVVGAAAHAQPTEDAEDNGLVIRIWVRGADASKKGARVDLGSRRKLEVTREDVQYGGKAAKYRGVPLRELLSVIEHTGRSDLALLHFSNGMVVPLPTDDLELLKTLDPFVAVEMERDGEWHDTFPPVKKPGAEARDARPLFFQRNKLVVGTTLHPSTTKEDQAAGFTPFSYAGSLTGIELVRAENWYRQFDLGRTDAEKRGLEIFKSHCQFCHAVRGAGGTYGVELVKDAPVAKRLGLQQLFLHVRYRDRDAPESGQMMPFFKTLSKEDVGALFEWLKAVTKARPMPYVPPPARD
jgi:mono/diheme cytochrome c family protein